MQLFRKEAIEPVGEKNDNGILKKSRSQKPEEVDKLASRVNLCLDDGLGLAEHGGGVEVGPVLVGHLVRHLEEHLDLVIDGDGLLVLLGREGSVNAELDQLGRGPVELGHLLLVVMWHHLIGLS